MSHGLFTYKLSRKFFGILLTTSSLIALNAFSAERRETSIDHIVAKHEKAKTTSSAKLNRPIALKALRAQKSISDEDYRHMKGASASQAALVADLHAKGVEGKSVRVWLLEDSGVNEHLDVLKYIDSSSDMKMAPGFSQKQDHGAAMASLAHQMAPKATLVIKHARDYMDKLKSGEKKPFIINASFNTGEVNLNDYFGPVFSLKFGPLIVKSAGNEGKILSKDDHYKELDPLLQKYLIIAGNLRQDGRPTASSGVPGDQKSIQDRFLWVIADDMLAAGGPTGLNVYKYTTGTSGAAAILSGAAALIKGKYPKLTMKEVAECLLESANRDLFQLFGDGYHAIHVVDGPTERIHEPAVENKAGAGSSASASRVQVRTIYYNPAQWGKGVLNVRNAMIYASIKSAFPAKESSELRRMMLDEIVSKEVSAATKIQKWWRANKKSIPESEKPLPLVVDHSISDRRYLEADGTYQGKSIPEPSPIDAGEREGFSYEKATGPLHKTPEEIRRERESLKTASKSIADQLREGLITLEDLKGRLKEKDSKALLEWFYENPSILTYHIEGKAFLPFVVSNYDWSGYHWDIKVLLLQGINDNFFEKYKPTIQALVQGLGVLDYVYFSQEGLLKSFIDKAFKHKDWFKEEDLGRLLFFAAKADSTRLDHYIGLFQENGYNPTETKSNDGSTILHLRMDEPKFREVLEYYIGKGILPRALLNARNSRDVTPFGMVAEGLGYSKNSDIESSLRYYLGKGALFMDGMFQEVNQREIISIFIRQGNSQTDDDLFKKDGWDYLSLEAIKRNFLGLKDRAFIFDVEGIDKNLSDFYANVPKSVEGFIRGQTCTSSAQWRRIVDEAWALFNTFLASGGEKTFEDWSRNKKPVMVESGGKPFYYPSFAQWSD